MYQSGEQERQQPGLLDDQGELRLHVFGHHDPALARQQPSEAGFIPLTREGVIVYAKAGDDELYGGAAEDELVDDLYGGRGDDRFVEGQDGAEDHLFCGEGHDTYTLPDPPDASDRVSASCEERLTFPTPEEPYGPHPMPPDGFIYD